MISIAHCVLLSACVLTADPASPQLPPGFDVEPVVIEVSKETTFLDGPLHKDGTVDYVTALDRINAKGVTKENNAAPLLWKAFGERWWSEEKTRDEQARKLGIDVPSPEVHCVTSLGDLPVIANADMAAKDGESPLLPAHWRAARALLSQEEIALLITYVDEQGRTAIEFHDSMNKATTRPWAGKDHPSLLIWIKLNAEPIKLLEEASLKPRYYMPYVDGPDSTVIGILLPSLGATREGGRLLCARAMLRIKEGNYEGAWQDYLTVNRLARLIAQLVALSLDSLSNPVLMALLESGSFTGAQLKSMAAQFDKLRHPSDFERSINLTERSSMLDMVGAMRRRGMRFIANVGDDEEPLTDEQIARNVRAVDLMIDSNQVLRSMNKLMDELVAVYSKPTALERIAAADALDERLSELAGSKPASTVAMIAGALLLPAEQRRKLTSEKMTQLLVSILMPAITSVLKTDEDARMRRELMQVAFSLAMHHAEHKVYPKALAELAPKYIAKVPVDRFDEKPLRYQRTDDGYILYSIGKDQQDNGGKSEFDESGMIDLVVQLPVPERP